MTVLDKETAKALRFMAIGRWCLHEGWMPPSEGRHGADGTVLLSHDDRQFGQSQLRLRGNLAELIWMAMVHLGALSRRSRIKAASGLEADNYFASTFRIG